MNLIGQKQCSQTDGPVTLISLSETCKHDCSPLALSWPLIGRARTATTVVINQAEFIICSVHKRYSESMLVKMISKISLIGHANT